MKNTHAKTVCIYLVVLALIALTASGCRGTYRARKVEKSGFLKDYSQLEKGESDQALLVYIDETAEFKKYDKILMDPVKAYKGVGESALGDISEEHLQALVDYLDSAVRSNLNYRYTFVEEPGPDVMHMRIAITEAQGAIIPLDIVSSVVPVGMALNALQTTATGKGSGVGAVGIEFELLDSQSGERLAAIVDKRVGGKYTDLTREFDRWKAAKGAFDEWTERLKNRLEELSNKQQ